MGIKDFDGTVDAAYLREMAGFIQDVKDRSYQMMNLSSGDMVLDVGCGPGIDAYNLLKLVGDHGKVIGLDNDEKMISEAQESYTGANVEFIRADVCSIPYPDNHFDAVRAERLFQVLPQEIEPESVLKELVRVTKENGIIVLVDTDWGSASVDYHDDELTNRLLHFFATKCRPSGFAGRQFYGLLRRNGVSILEVEVKPILMFDFNETPLKQWLTKEALDNNIATKTELDSWNAELVEKTEKNEFFSSANMILISGRI